MEEESDNSTNNGNSSDQNETTPSRSSSSEQETPTAASVALIPLPLPPSPSPPPPPLPPLPPPQQKQQQQHTVPTPTLAPGSSSRGGGVSCDDWSGKKKRGRPRKHDRNLLPECINVPARTIGLGVRGGRVGDRRSSISSEDFLSIGEELTPHILRVTKVGEDIVQRILSFTRTPPIRGVTVLSATGPISNVTLLQSGSRGGSVTYEGRFEILSLSGSFPQPDPIRGQTGPLTTSLAGPDGQVIGGVVIGELKAAAAIQIVLASFTLKRKPSETALRIRATPVSQVEACSDARPDINKPLHEE